jgi:hypothetical protein
MSNGQDTPLHLRGNVKLPQDSETPLTPLRVPVGTALYLYIRSVDSVNANTIGQDYVTFRYQGKDLAFAVCDGVGQSFMGDLAARLLGDELVEWLLKLQRPANAEAFSKATADALNAMTKATAPQVASYKLPEQLPPILIQALENQRKYGSESMFVAGRLALGGTDPWVALCWLGDSPVAAVDIDGELVDLGPHGSTSERWNATTGVKGEVHTWVGDAKRVARVAGYTDGLGTSHVPTDADLVRMVAGWMDNNPPADDASLFDVRLAYSPETVGAQTPDETRRMLNLPASASEPGYFNIEMPAEAEARPIVVDDGERSPVAEMTPIEVPPQPTPATGEWKPLTEKGQADAAKTAIEKALTQIPVPTPLGDLSTQQQVQMWQQAALLGLTSAALAMMMLERLITKPDKDS